jgi:hypothetical protein
MTRAELHSVQGFHAPTLIAAAAHLRTSMKRARSYDATTIINNEGRMNGYLDAIEDLIAATLPEKPEAKKKDFQPYAAPAQPQPENPNRL